MYPTFWPRSLQTILFLVLLCAIVWILVNILSVLDQKGLRYAGALDGVGAVMAEAGRGPTQKPAPAPVDGAAANGNADTPRGNDNPPPLPRSATMFSVLFGLCGALGATLHGLGSLVAFAGNGKFKGSWAFWYLAQPFRGAILAAGFFWLVQGGLLGSVGNTSLDPMAMMGATFLVGLFSDPAIEKLREVFQVLFRTVERQRQDPLAPTRRPRIASVAYEAGPPAMLKIVGERFDDHDDVVVNDAEIDVKRRSPKTLEIELPSGLAAQGKTLKIMVRPTQANADASDVYESKIP